MSRNCNQENLRVANEDWIWEVKMHQVLVSAAIALTNRDMCEELSDEDRVCQTNHLLMLYENEMKATFEMMEYAMGLCKKTYQKSPANHSKV